MLTFKISKIANLLEMQADALLDAADAGQDIMPSGEYLRMSNEALRLWKEAQELKGNTSPPVNLKAPTASAPIEGVLLKCEEQQNQEPTTSAKLIELWIVWENDTFPIVGIKKWEAELVSAFVHLDIPKIKKICEEQKLEKLFDDLATLTHSKVAQILTQTGAIKGEMKETDLEQLLKKYGKKGKEAVKQYFTFWSKAAASSKKENKRSKRGEHIINNGVLKLHRDIMNDFLCHKKIINLGLGTLPFTVVNGKESRIMNDCFHYFRELEREPGKKYNKNTISEVEINIQDILKVHFEQNELYIDGNALIYGKAIQKLREAAVEHMVELYFNPSNKGSHSTQPLREAINFINEWVLYVDQYALTKWRQLNGNGGEATYERARNAVWGMFDGLYDRLGWWINEIRRHGVN